MPETFPAFLAFTALLVVTPGSTTAVVVSHTLAGGRSAGIRVAFGAALGNITQSLVAGVGIGALLLGAPAGQRLLRLAGGAYLLYLGLRHVVSAWRGWRADSRTHNRTNNSTDNGADSGATAQLPRTAPLRDGLLTNILNPAITTFYLVAVPTFLPTRELRFRQDALVYALYTAVHVTLAFVCHCGWASGLARVRAAWSGGVARVMLSAMTGLALVVLALRILR